ncbi:MAG TPA: hypothetical protein VN108_07005 [Marmoricola sp.]|nr:hypothetical protein [Marmoricola sp.]
MHSLDVLTCFFFACILVPLGYWGWQAADDLISPALPSEERQHRIEVLRRGAIACEVVAVLLFGAAFLLIAAN